MVDNLPEGAVLSPVGTIILPGKGDTGITPGGIVINPLPALRGGLTELQTAGVVTTLSPTEQAKISAEASKPQPVNIGGSVTSITDVVSIGQSLQGTPEEVHSAVIAQQENYLKEAAQAYDIAQASLREGEILTVPKEAFLAQAQQQFQSGGALSYMASPQVVAQRTYADYIINGNVDIGRLVTAFGAAQAMNIAQSMGIESSTVQNYIDFTATHTNFGTASAPAWLKNEDVIKLKEQNPALYDRLEKQGYDAFQSYVVDLSRYNAQHIPVRQEKIAEDIKPYAIYSKTIESWDAQGNISSKPDTTSEIIGYDLVTYLRDRNNSQEALQNLNSAGFTPESISASQNTLSAFYGIGGTPVGEKPTQDTFVKDYFTRNSWVMNGTDFPEHIKEAQNAYHEQYNPKITAATFAKNYAYQKLGNTPITVTGYDASGEMTTNLDPLMNEGFQRYRDLYGQQALSQSLTSEILDSMIIPAKPLDPSIRWQDLTATDYALGAVQVALLAVGIKGLPVGGLKGITNFTQATRNLWSKGEFINNLSSSANKLGQTTKEMEASLAKLAKTDTGNVSAYTRASSNAQTVVGEADLAHRQFVNQLDNSLSGITPKQLASLEKTSGVVGLKNSIGEIKSAYTELNTAWAKADSQIFGTPKYIESLNNVTKAQNRLEKSFADYNTVLRSKADAIGARRSETIELRTRSTNWANRSQELADNMFNAEQELRFARSVGDFEEASRIQKVISDIQGDIKALPTAQRLEAEWNKYVKLVEQGKADQKLRDELARTLSGADDLRKYGGLLKNPNLYPTSGTTLEVEVTSFLDDIASKPRTVTPKGKPPEGTTIKGIQEKPPGEGKLVKAKKPVEPKPTPETQTESAGKGGIGVKEQTGVPSMMTKKMEIDLRGKGFSQSDIDNMTPKEAWDALGGYNVKNSQVLGSAIQGMLFDTSGLLPAKTIMPLTMNTPQGIINITKELPTMILRGGYGFSKIAIIPIKGYVATETTETQMIPVRTAVYTPRELGLTSSQFADLRRKGLLDEFARQRELRPDLTYDQFIEQMSLWNDIEDILNKKEVVSEADELVKQAGEQIKKDEFLDKLLKTTTLADVFGWTGTEWVPITTMPTLSPEPLLIPISTGSGQASPVPPGVVPGIIWKDGKWYVGTLKPEPSVSGIAWTTQLEKLTPDLQQKLEELSKTMTREQALRQLGLSSDTNLEYSTVPETELSKIVQPESGTEKVTLPVTKPESKMKSETELVSELKSELITVVELAPKTILKTEPVTFGGTNTFTEPEFKSDTIPDTITEFKTITETPPPAEVPPIKPITGTPRPKLKLGEEKKKEEEQEEKKKSILPGSIAWVQGALRGGRVIKYIPPPYKLPKPITLVGVTPVGFVENGKTPKETIQIIGKARGVPKTVAIDLGFVDIFVYNGNRIQFRGGGLRTNVGGDSSPTQGMSIDELGTGTLEKRFQKKVKRKTLKAAKKKSKKISGWDYMTTLKGYKP